MRPPANLGATRPFPRSPRTARGARLPARASPASLRRWITGGNTLARVGVVVLFIGVAFLLKYASEHVTVPIEVRLAGVALAASACSCSAGACARRRAGYAMSLQGAAIGILYLTVFAALRLYQLLPPVAAFALLFWIAALSSFLAIRQDAMALAVLGIARRLRGADPDVERRRQPRHAVLVLRGAERRRSSRSRGSRRGGC